MTPAAWLHPECRATPSTHSQTLIRIGPVFSDWAIDQVRSLFEHGQGWEMAVPWSRLARVIDHSVHPGWPDLVHELEQFVAQQGLQHKIAQSKLFLDIKTYQTTPHWDDPAIEAMMQIYVAPQNLTQPGTVFNDPLIDLVEFRPNHGYINVNRDLKTHESAQVARGYRASIAFQLV